MSYLSIDIDPTIESAAKNIVLHPTKYSSYVLGYNHNLFYTNGITIYLKDVRISVSPYHISIHISDSEKENIYRWSTMFQEILKEYDPGYTLRIPPIHDNVLNYPTNDITRNIVSKHPKHIHLTFKSLYPIDGEFRTVSHIH